MQTRYTGNVEQIRFNDPLAVKQSTLICLLVFLLLIGASRLPSGGTLDRSSGGRREIFFLGDKHAHRLTQNQSACFYRSLGL